MAQRIFRANMKMQSSKGKLFDHYRSIIVSVALEMATVIYDKKRAERTKTAITDNEV